MTSFCHSSPRHSRYNRMYAPQTFYCHESQLRSFWLRVFVTVHRAIRKTQLRCFPLLTQLLLLIDWRSLRGALQSDFRVNTKSACRTLRVFITVHRAIRKNAAALLSAACAAPFAHRMALPSWCSADRFSCKHEICLQNPTSELLYRKMYNKREKFLKKSLAILQGLLYTTKCCDMIAKKHKVAATENT